MRLRRGLLLVGMVAGSVALGRTGSAAGTAATAQVHFALDLDGFSAGFVTSASGGAAHTAAPVTRAVAAATRYDDISVTTGEPNKWVCLLAKEMLDGASKAHDGSIITADYDFKELSRLSFLHAMVDEVTFPALDLASKDTARLSIELAPEKTAARQGGGDSVKSPLAPQKKSWLLSSFRVRIQGMSDADNAAIARVGAVVATRSVAFGPNGLPTATAPKVAPFQIVVPASRAAAFEAWAKGAASGESGAAKNVSIDFLAPNMTDVVLTLQLRSVLPAKVDSSVTASGSTAPQTVRLDLRAQSAALVCGTYFP